MAGWYNSRTQAMDQLGLKLHMGLELGLKMGVYEHNGLITRMSAIRKTRIIDSDEASDFKYWAACFLAEGISPPGGG